VPDLLNIDKLTVSYPASNGSLKALDEFNLSVGSGEVVGILGESGSGKSTVLRAILRLLPAESKVAGRVMFAGSDMLKLPEEELSATRGAKIAMIYQDPIAAFDPVFTVGQQISEMIVRHEKISQRDATRRALELLDLVHIPMASRRLNAFPHELSGGMRQRAMIALALSCRPALLLADEPTSSLDVTVQMQILLLLKELQKTLDMAMILVTHDIAVAAETCDRVAVLYAGTLVEAGAVADVILAPGHPYTEGLLLSSIVGSQRGSRLTAIRGAPPDLADLPPGCKFEPRCNYASPACSAARPAQYAPGPSRIHRCIRNAAGEIDLKTPVLG
jgi:peptide/nickel transport system ATP-binding protein